MGLLIHSPVCAPHPPVESSNFKGHQFNLGYALTDDLNIVARLYLVQSITTEEANERFRVDVNYKF